MQSRKIILLGHGEIGQALETLLKPRHQLQYWERDLARWKENISLESLLADQCDLILFALPANPHRELAQRVHAAAAPAVSCVTVAKGLDDAGHPPAVVFDSVFGREREFGVLYGPMIGDDLSAGRPGFACVASASKRLHALVAEVFAGSYLHLRFSEDVAGASWAVILKNIYVPLIGAAEGAGLGDNIRGYLVAAALRELARIVEIFGGKAETVYGLPGVGDLVATATSAGSHHRVSGIQLGRGESGGLKAIGVNIRGEGFHALQMLEKHQLVDFTRFPLLRALRALLAEPKHARRILLDLCMDPNVAL